ncbi:MAG: MCE family protein, partial [Phycisphaerales bacterium]|nr:MCE family protein [Phycisphaerales bacterium]
MSERTRNVIVGITSLLGLGGLVFLLTIFGYLPGWMEDGYIVHVQLKSASGLSIGSRVLMNGIDIGRVTVVGLENTATGPKVSVGVRIRPDVGVPAGVRVRAEAPFIGGSPTLAFDASHLDPRQPDYSKLIAPLPLDGTAVIVGETFNPLGELAEQFRTALAEPSRSFEKVADNFEKLSNEWVLVAQNLNAVLEPRLTG